MKLLRNGLVVCDKCLDPTDRIDKDLLPGDTYHGDVCDVCGYSKNPDPRQIRSAPSTVTPPRSSDLMDMMVRD